MEQRRHTERNSLPPAEGEHRRTTLMHRRYDRPSRVMRLGWWKKNDPEEPSDHALGHSRGGFTTKIRILCAGDDRPLGHRLPPGEAHESTALIAILEDADAELVDGDGKPVAWSFALAGDKGYRAEWLDDCLLELGVKPVILSKANEDRDTRRIEFDQETYRKRNIVERLIGWLKESRRIFSRFEKTAKNFSGMIKMAFIHRYLRLLYD